MVKISNLYVFIVRKKNLYKGEKMAFKWDDPLNIKNVLIKTFPTSRNTFQLNFGKRLTILDLERLDCNL